MSGLISEIYYIGSGRKNKLYTLRCKTAFEVPNTGGIGFRVEERHAHIQTLAATSDKAKEKAERIVERRREAYKKNGRKHYLAPLQVNGLYNKLGKIKHRSEEEIEDEKLKWEEELKQRLINAKESEREKVAFAFGMVEAGLMPYGKHNNKKFKDLPKSYVQWMLNQPVEKKAVSYDKKQDKNEYLKNLTPIEELHPVDQYHEEKYRKEEKIYEKIEALKPQWETDEYLKDWRTELWQELHVAVREALKPFDGDLPKANGKHFGKEGEKYDFNGKVVSLRSYESQWGMVQIVEFVIDSGELIVYKGNSLHKQLDWEIEEGDELSFSAQVKEHSEWNDVKQSRVLRPKLIN